VLFFLLKLYARFAIKLYCRKITINKPEYLKVKGPVLLAANHPNSFLDGMILTTLFQENIYSLARGDAFKNPFFRRFLYWLHLRPVYRTSEGSENLTHNYTTFEACHDVFEKNGIVVIFSEGRCMNEWHLRPLRKGTARLAVSAWKKNIDLTVIPVGINYNSFRNFGKNVVINFGEPIHKESVMDQQSEGLQFLAFNQQLRTELHKAVYEIALTDRKKLEKKLKLPVPAWKKILLLPFAIVGFIIHAPLYLIVKTITCYYFDNDHFDSVMAAILLLVYPVQLLIVGLFVFYFYGTAPALNAIMLTIFSAWSYVQLKPQFNRHFRADNIKR
jgi:1-acyl-sn-glycerol-3-phosphate acyltransferase